MEKINRERVYTELNTQSTTLKRHILYEENSFSSIHFVANQQQTLGVDEERYFRWNG